MPEDKHNRQPPHRVYDGFCECDYDEDTDGWILLHYSKK